MAKRRKSFSDQLRAIIADCGMSRNQLCKLAGLDPTQLHRFVHKTGKLTNETIDRLADVLGVQLTAKPIKRK